MDFVVPDQVIDRTKGIRPFTFFEGGVVGHVGFADPFDAGLARHTTEIICLTITFACVCVARKDRLNDRAIYYLPVRLIFRLNTAQCKSILHDFTRMHELVGGYL